MVSLTIFDSIYDNKTNKRMDYNSFDEFEQVLYKLSESERHLFKILKGRINSKNKVKFVDFKRK